MNAFRRANGGGRCCGGRSRCRLYCRYFSWSVISYAPDPAPLIVRNVERPIRPDCQPRWPMRGLAGFFDGSGEAIGEHHELARGLAVSEGLKHDIVPALRKWRT